MRPARGREKQALGERREEKEGEFFLPHSRKERSMSSTVIFTRVADSEARIHDADSDYVGDLFGHPDILKPGEYFYVLHLSEDPRGPVRVHERSRVREVAQRLLDTHPLMP